MDRENEALLIMGCFFSETLISDNISVLWSLSCLAFFSGPWKLFSLSKLFPHHTDNISSADLQDFLNFPSQPKFPQSEGHLPPSGACTLVRFMLPWIYGPYFPTRMSALPLCTFGCHLNEERGHGVGALDLVDTQYYCEQELSLWWTPTQGSTVVLE